MVKVFLLAAAACAIQAAAPAQSQEKEPLTWHQGGAPAPYVELRSERQPILRYNYGVQLPPGVPEDRARCCYIYPLWTPGGVSPLDDFPKDHFHHRGLFWAWPDVRVAGASYDGWMMKGLKTVHKSHHTELKDAGRIAVLRVENEWVVGGQTIARAQEQYEIHERDGRGRTLDAALTLTAVDAPVTLHGSREVTKSYGGLSLRFAPRERTVIRTEKGISEKDEDLNPHDWAELEAVYNGHKAAVRIDNNDSNDGGTPQWCLRHYGFLGAAFPGRNAKRDSFTLEPRKPLTLRYSITISDR